MEFGFEIENDRGNDGYCRNQQVMIKPKQKACAESNGTGNDGGGIQVSLTAIGLE